LSNPTATKSERTNNRKEVTVTELKNNSEPTESYFVPPQPRRQNTNRNKTCNNQNRVSNRKATMSLMNRKIDLKSYNFVEASLRLTLSICEGREFIERQARYKCPIENINLKLTTKSQITNVQPKLMLIVNYSRR